jgi:hypothetical protein
MQHASKQVSDAQHQAQRSVVLLALEHDTGIVRPMLETQLDDLGYETTAEALARLSREQVIAIDGDRVRASRCARWLSTLDLICL